jgi:hypothetical protein
MPVLSIRWIMTVACAALLGGVGPALAVSDDEAIGFERTPPRLSFTDGDVSFLRPGAEDWTPAYVNTALAAGDELYADEGANLELQVAARAYVRAGEYTQLGLMSLEPDFLQLRVTSGTVSLDLRSLKASQTLEIDTPNGAFTVENSGYYRVEVDYETTTFTCRRGGRATLTPATGESLVIAASEQVVVTGDEAQQIESYAAPELDAWDRWNYARTDEQLDAVSARYVPAEVYGVDDLDHHGDWRVVPTYGPIWVPRGLGSGWAPYSTGRWIWDPFYAWTWVDDAPWGWAPYHYGRWVRASGYWGWCPGPIVTRPYYAPALVGFFGGGGVSVGVTIGTPYVGWTALGWGEPLIPWWGSARFRSHAHWAGWGGPRYVNNVVVKKKTVIKVKEINIYRNAGERDAFVMVERERFGRGDHKAERFKRGKHKDLKPVHGEHPVRPVRASLVAESKSATRPPDKTWKRSVVATRKPRRDPTPDFEPRRGDSKRASGSSRGEPRVRDAALDATPPTRVVEPRGKGKRVRASNRAPFGKRGDSERAMPPPAPRFERSARIEGERGAADTRAKGQPRRDTAPAPPGERETKRDSAPRGEKRQATPQQRPAPKPKPAPPERAERPRPERRERAAPRTPDLPGEPANRVLGRDQQRKERARSQPGGAARSSQGKEKSGRSGGERKAQKNKKKKGGDEDSGGR